MRDLASFTAVGSPESGFTQPRAHSFAYNSLQKLADPIRVNVGDIYFSGQRLEECSPGGCYMELCLQMAIIFVGKQFLLSFVEYQLPRLWKLYNSFKVKCSSDKFELYGCECLKQYASYLR